MTAGEPDRDSNGEGPARPEPDPDPDPLDVDAAFAEIIAGWSDEADPEAGSGRWTSEDHRLPGAHREPPGAEAPEAPGVHREPPGAHRDPLGEGPDDTPLPIRPLPRRRDVPPMSGRHSAGGGSHEPPGELGAPVPAGTGSGLPADDPQGRSGRAGDHDSERYVPPEPPPLPRGDVVTRLLWACTIGGPAFLLLAALVWRDAPGLLVALGVLAFIGGFVTLVLRMPHERGEDDDDGAVV